MKNCLQLYICGKWVGDHNNPQLPVINPATEETVSHVYCATEENLQRAVKGAEDAFKEWAHTSVSERSKILEKAADNLKAKADEVARQLTIQQGKPIGEARMEVLAAVQAFVWASKAVLNIEDITYPDSPGHYSQKTMYEPVGVVAGFSPWNFPIMLTARKITNALAAGCCIIIKPAEEAPHAALALAAALHDAGLPSGVLNMVFGNPGEISEYLIKSSAVRKVSLTGSTAVGKLLARIASDSLTPCVLELGGHAPVLVFDDINVDDVAKELAMFKFRNAGQVCLSPSRFFIHENVYDEFVERFVKYASNLKVGDGLDPETNVGPLAHENRLEAVDHLVTDAISKGATCILGGARVSRSGYFYEPTILTNVPEDAELLKTEIFGPVAVFSKFTDIDDVLMRANDVPYGLASYLFTRDNEKIKYIKPRLQAGLVSVNITTPILENVPFGGMRDSGYGYEGGKVGLEAFMHLKLVHEK